MTKESLLAALKRLGVVRAASKDDPLRWSVTDLFYELDQDRPHCGYKHHHATCRCDGVAGDR